MLQYIILSTIVISLISFVGALTLVLKPKILDEIVHILVALSAGALMGGAFLHLLPESLEELLHINLFLAVLVGFTLFFIIEKFIHWRHCHDKKCKIHSFAYMNLIGDGVHNFIDGLIIAAGFVVNIPLGIVTSLAIALHEIPQEIGDFGVLVYGGFKRTKALTINFLTALAAVAGGIFGYFLHQYIQSQMILLLPFAAGGFVYIAASDLTPELRKEENMRKFTEAFITFLIGIAIMWFIKFL